MDILALINEILVARNRVCNSGTQLEDNKNEKAINKKIAFDRAYGFFEDKTFTTKQIQDRQIFVRLIKPCKLNQEDYDKVILFFEELYDTVRSVYMTLNIEPRLNFPDDVRKMTLEERENLIEDFLTKLVHKYYYRYSPEERKEIYSSEVKSYVDNVLESLDNKVDANELSKIITEAIRVAVIKRILYEIAFPPFIQAAIEYVINDENISRVFDIESLMDTLENVDKGFTVLARVIAKGFKKFIEDNKAVNILPTIERDFDEIASRYEEDDHVDETVIAKELGIGDVTEDMIDEVVDEIDKKEFDLDQMDEELYQEELEQERMLENIEEE